MTQEERRKDVLDLLARGKITIDEAVILLERSSDAQIDVIEEQKPVEEEISLKVDVSLIEEEEVGDKLPIEDIPSLETKQAGAEPRWLRISVSDLDTGKSKVKVNIPFGMVKFGMGIARVFAPGEYSTELDTISEMVATADSGLLVDVRDDEDNEHVRIYFD